MTSHTILFCEIYENVCFVAKALNKNIKSCNMLPTLKNIPAILLQKFACFQKMNVVTRGGYGAAATSKMECFVVIVIGFQSLTIITKHSILDVAAALDPPLVTLLV